MHFSFSHPNCVMFAVVTQLKTIGDRLASFFDFVWLAHQLATQATYLQNSIINYSICDIFCADLRNGKQKNIQVERVRPWRPFQQNSKHIKSIYGPANHICSLAKKWVLSRRQKKNRKYLTGLTQATQYIINKSFFVTLWLFANTRKS